VSDRHSHILFDFFGTLVDYTDGPAVTPARSLAVVNALGPAIDAPEFNARWAAEWERWEAGCAAELREFSMVDVATSFLPGAAPSDVDAFVAAYIAEWNAGVRYLPGLDTLLSSLASRWRLAVVSNTHEPDLVPSHLAAMGVADLVEVVVTSVEVGVRKPHPAIYASALTQLGITAGDAVFVGDNPVADYTGPVAAGMTAFLIDPAGRHPVPAAHRLDSIFDLPGRLARLPDPLTA